MALRIAALILLFAFPAWAEEWRGSPRVVDGDTVMVGGVRLRLISLDAPEGKQTCQDAKQQDFDCGQEASRELARLIAGREISCIGEKRDRYGRPLVVCMVGDLNLNAELVRSGWAVSYLGHEFDREEAEARTARRGLWAGQFQLPADWRHDSRKAQAPVTR